MNIQDLLKAAQSFANSVSDQAPKSCTVDDLDWLDQEEKNLIRANGKNDVYLPHNPPGSVASESTWDRAKKAVKKYWSKYDEPWAVVFDVYRQMGGKLKHRRK